MEDVYGEYWDVCVCKNSDTVEPKYVVWLLNTLGYAGPRNWEWREVHPYSWNYVNYVVRFRREEDAMAFKLKFGL